MKPKFPTFLKSIYDNIIILFFWPILICLCFFSLISTSTTSMDDSELTYYLSDKLYIHIIVLIAIIFILSLIAKSKAVRNFSSKINNDCLFFKKVRLMLVMSVLISAGLWVISTQYIPLHDQGHIMNAVYSLHLGTYNIFAPGQYMARYPQQLGLVWFYYFISFFIGVNNYVGLQLINVLALGLFYYSLSRICELLYFSKTTQLAVIVCGLFFSPGIIYCSYIYGNILGLGLSAYAIYYELKYFTTIKFKDALISAVSIGLAVCLKSNYLIFMIGMVIYSLFKILSNRTPAFIPIIILFASAYILQANIPVNFTRSVTGQPLDQSTNTWSWIAMGMQECEKAPGWYNGYNWDSFTQSGFNNYTQGEVAKYEIKNSLLKFINNPDHAVSFFTKKTVSQWNNPTFQSIWTLQILDTVSLPSGWAYYITSPDGSMMVKTFMNIFQSLVYFGTIFYFVFSIKDELFSDSLILAMIFIGGFIFHSIWEAKSQYVFSYFILLFPYFTEGFCKLVNYIIKFNNLNYKNSFKKIIFSPYITLSVLTAVIFFALHSESMLYYIKSDTVEFNKYLDIKNQILVENDTDYILKTSDGYILSHGLSEGYYVPIIYLSEKYDNNSIITYIRYQSDVLLNLKASNLYFTYTEDGEIDKYIILALEQRFDDIQCWKIEDVGNGQVFIHHDNKYLSYDSDTMTVFTTSYNGSDNQKWTFEKA